MESPLRFHDPDSVVKAGTNRLTHWHQKEAVYFLTFRLADAVPAASMRAYVQEREQWMASKPPPPWPPEVEKEYRRRFTGRFERWLDRGYGTCVLRDSGNAKIVEDTFRYFEGVRSRLHAWVVMPNHVHVLASLVADETVAALLRTWKGYTARQINDRRGVSGPLWQKGYFDRIVRDWDHFGQCVRYIRSNPQKAGLKKGEFLHGESEFVRRKGF